MQYFGARVNLVVGGVLVGTFLTLFVIPTFYTLLVRRRRAVLEDEAPRSMTQ